MNEEEQLTKSTGIVFRSDQDFLDAGGVIPSELRNEACALIPSLQGVFTIALQHPNHFLAPGENGWSGFIAPRSIPDYKVFMTHHQQWSALPKPYFYDVPSGKEPVRLRQDSGSAEDMYHDYLYRLAALEGQSTTPSESAIIDKIAVGHPKQRTNYIVHVQREGVSHDEINVFTLVYESGKENRRNCGIVALFLPRNEAQHIMTLMNPPGNYYHVLTGLYSRILSPQISLHLLLKGIERTQLFCLDPFTMVAQLRVLTVVPVVGENGWVSLQLKK